MTGKGLSDNPTQQLICVDSYGTPTGEIIDRKAAHTTPGTKHFAIQILVFNSKKELILHERHHHKVGGGTLDAPTTHVLAHETPMSAATRCLENEYGIKDKVNITVLGGFSYEKDYKDGTCENEFCLAAYTTYDGTIRENKDEAEKVVVVPAKKLLHELVINPERFTVWFKETVSIVKRHDKGGRRFFD